MKGSNNFSNASELIDSYLKQSPYAGRDTGLSKTSTAILLECLPKEIRKHCNSLFIKENKATLILTNKAIESSLRFYEKDIIRNLSGVTGQEIKKIGARLETCVKPPKSAAKTNSALRSNNGAQVLEDTARHVSNPGLSSALKQLAKAIRPTD